MKYFQLYKEIVTDKGTLIAEENEITVGSEVFIDENGNINPAPDGTYENIEYIIIVENGVVKEIIEKEKEDIVEEVDTKEEIIKEPVEDVFETTEEPKEETKEEQSETTSEEVKEEIVEEPVEEIKEETSEEHLKELDELKATIEEQRKEIESLKTLVKEYEEKETALLDPALGENEDKIEDVDPRLVKALKAAEILKKR